MSFLQKKHLKVWRWLSRIPLGLGIYALTIYLAPNDSSLAYYLFVNLFAIPFVLVVTTFWDAFDGARAWAKYFIGVQPLLWLFFWPQWQTLAVIVILGLLCFSDLTILNKVRRVITGSHEDGKQCKTAENDENQNL